MYTLIKILLAVNLALLLVLLWPLLSMWFKVPGAGVFVMVCVHAWWWWRIVRMVESRVSG